MMEEEREEMREGTSSGFEHQTRDNGSQVFREVYSEGAIERLKHLIKVSYEQKNNRFYSIDVDGEKVVKKTCDVRKFDGYKKYLNPFTKIVTVQIYKGYSFNCNRYEFTVNQGLSGLPGQSSEERIQKAIADYKREQAFLNLQRELKKKTKKLKELKVIVEQIEAENLEKGNSFDFNKATEMVKQTLGIVSQIRGNTPQSLGEAPTDSEVEIKPIEEQKDKSKKTYEDHGRTKKKRSEEERLFKTLFNDLGSEQIIEIVNFMQQISKHPDLSAKFQHELSNKTNG